jgi:hypothetical protein
MGAIMHKRTHQMSIIDQPDFDGFDRISATFELPAADEFACTDDEVREACAVLEGIQGSLMD